MLKTITLPCFDMVISIVEGGGSLSSNLHIDEPEGDEKLYEAAINGLESLILSLASEGVDIATPSFVRSIEDSVQAIENHYG